MREWYRRKTPEERRAWIARKDPEAQRRSDRKRNKTERRRASLQASKDRYPEKQRARDAVHNAVSRGKLTKKPCEVCDDPTVQAHHPDHSRRLVVVWLCKRHHDLVHGKRPIRG